jgi:hypothetical protein
MKFNKWTLGLAAVGVVSLASAARADEKMNSLQTALSDTTISGYVSASANWQVIPGGGLASPASLIPFQGVNKQDGFNLDVVKLSISKPQDESPWASGYQVDLLFGPDAANYNTSANAVGGQSGSGGGNVGGQLGTGFSSADFAIKQAYVALRTPIGSQAIDWKIGVFDTIIGYEVFDSDGNPNYTRSWGYFLEPTEHTGVLGTYKLNDQWSFSAGIANTLAAGINARDTQSTFGTGSDSFWQKTFMGSATFTAPSSWGWAAGSSLYAGIVYGFEGSLTSGFGNPPPPGDGGDNHADGNQVNYYFGATLNTPLKQLTTGLAFDYVQNFGGGFPGNSLDIWDVGLYATWKATDKLSFNGRGEYLSGQFDSDHGSSPSSQVYELTGTVEYDLWANVVSRIELRWDHFVGDFGELVDTDFDKSASIGLYANIVYKF